MRINIISLFILLSASSFAQTWEVPADKKDKASSFTFNEASQKQGEAVFNKSCVACHGNPGQGNYNKTLVPSPPDPASEKMQNQTDGSLFYKITVGKGLMPSFKNVVSETDRWNIVSYFRSFNKNYKQPPLAIAVDSTKIKMVRIESKYDSSKYIYHLTVKALTNTGIVSLPNSEVSLFVNRYFGIMQVETTKQTDANGAVSFKFSKNIPGDKLGKLMLTIKVNNEQYGEISKLDSLKNGIPTDKPSLTAKRAMWNELSKAPIWLLVAYNSVVLGIWSFLIIIVLRIFKINKLGKNN